MLLCRSLRPPARASYLLLCLETTLTLLQAKVYWDATVVTNDPPFPEHQHWAKRWMAEVE